MASVLSHEGNRTQTYPDIYAYKGTRNKVPDETGGLSKPIRLSLKTVPKLDTHSATVLHLLRQPVHRRGSDSNHGLGLDTLFIDTHEQNFIRRLLPLELELLLSCTTTKTPNT